MSHQKSCCRCGQSKATSEFRPSKQNSDGLSGWCRECQNEYSREQRRKVRDRGVTLHRAEKKCTTCKEVLPVAEFHRDAGRSDGLQPSCKGCNQSKQQEIGKRRTEAYVGPTVTARVCSRCGVEKPSADFTVEKRNKSGLSCDCKECQHQGYREFRHTVLSHYSQGEPRCACCGETHLEFLSLDHVNGGGDKHRKEIGCYAAALYRWLVKNGYPEGFRVLCHNCNQSYGFYGYCPHQRA